MAGAAARWTYRVQYRNDRSGHGHADRVTGVTQTRISSAPLSHTRNPLGVELKLARLTTTASAGSGGGADEGDDLTLRG